MYGAWYIIYLRFHHQPMRRRLLEPQKTKQSVSQIKAMLHNGNDNVDRRSTRT